MGSGGRGDGPGLGHRGCGDVAHLCLSLPVGANPLLPLTLNFSINEMVFIHLSTGFIVMNK